MRKILIGGLLIAGGASAFAQSSVTVYGVADTFLGFAKGTAKDTRLADGGNVASQLGFRGKEDMGGGMSAVFTLEGGFNQDSGVGNIPGPGFTFTRQSFVGVEGTSWGSLTLGRQYTPIFRTVWRADPMGVNSVFSPVTLWAQTDSQPGLQAWAARSDNAIMYTSPAGSIQGSLMYAPGEATNSSGNYLGASLHYSAGPLYVGYGYQTRNSGTAAAPAASPIANRSHVLAALYNMGNIQIGGDFGRQGSKTTGSPSATIYNINTKFTFGSSAILADYGNRDVTNSGNDMKAFTLGYDYALSKRTSLYARHMAVTNKSAGATAFGGVAAAAGTNVTLTGFGITHKF